MKNFTSLSDLDNLQNLIKEIIQLKKENPFSKLGKGKTLGLLFFNTSLRTRLSTEKAARLLGMEVLTVNVDKDAWPLEFDEGAKMIGQKAEHIKEAAAVLSQYCDILAIRAFPDLKDRKRDASEFVLKGFLKYASVTIINM